MNMTDKCWTIHHLHIIQPHHPPEQVLNDKPMATVNCIENQFLNKRNELVEVGSVVSEVRASNMMLNRVIHEDNDESMSLCQECPMRRLDGRNLLFRRAGDEFLF